MSNFVIITDSSCDLNFELRERFGVSHDYVKGLVYNPDGTSAESSCDWDDLTAKAYFASMTNKKNVYKSSIPSIEAVVTIFKKHLDLGEDILGITISSGLSGMNNLFNVAKKRLENEYPERKIIIVDSYRYSTSLAVLLMNAGMLKKEGKSIEEVANWVNENKNTVHQMGPMDDLFFLSRSGRISKTKAIMGSLIGIKPLADFNTEGMSTVVGKAKGYNQAFLATVKYIKQTIINPNEQIIFVAHSNREEQAQKLKQLIIKHIRPKEIIVNSVGKYCGANIGPGLIAAFYIGKPISEGVKQETELMEDILDNI